MILLDLSFSILSVYSGWSEIIYGCLFGCCMYEDKFDEAGCGAILELRYHAGMKRGGSLLIVIAYIDFLRVSSVDCCRVSS